jgi:hypothetical protein
LPPLELIFPMLTTVPVPVPAKSGVSPFMK